MGARFKEGYRQAVTDGISGWSFSAQLINADADPWVPDRIHEQNYSDLPPGALVGAPVALTSVTFDGDQFTADPTTIVFAVDPDEKITGWLLYRDTGSPASSCLLDYIDEGYGLVLDPTNAAGTLSVVVNGGDGVIARIGYPTS
jgi:hypothetical protein